jgi:hypothetical protein
LKKQKTCFKTGQQTDVLTTLRPCTEPEGQAETPMRNAYRSLSNRPGQFDSLAAIKAHLLFGSGEVESAHRSLIQKRFKLPGTKWLTDNAQAMLNLRPMRANQQWHSYWQTLQS